MAIEAQQFKESKIPSSTNPLTEGKFGRQPFAAKRDPNKRGAHKPLVQMWLILFAAYLGGSKMKFADHKRSKERKWRMKIQSTCTRSGASDLRPDASIPNRNGSVRARVYLSGPTFLVLAEISLALLKYTLVRVWVAGPFFLARFYLRFERSRLRVRFAQNADNPYVFQNGKKTADIVAAGQSHFLLASTM